jgi:hypothetical protein
MKNGKIVYRDGGWKIVRHEGRETPYTVWLGSEVVGFAKTLSDAGKIMSRVSREIKPEQQPLPNSASLLHLP